ncbi:hypothetical protein K474DRAFT_1708271 [Panus rudis PR-1116 ss-1]|nr:hypothetical protein K474DRAFT_1708271 [Panus rudis PR-1116 ss-1]
MANAKKPTKKRAPQKRRHSSDAAEDGETPSKTNTSGSFTSARKRVRWEGNIGSAAEDDDDDTDEDALLDKRYLAAICQFGRIGCAYYDPITCKMYVFADTTDNAHYDLVGMLLEQIDPDVILTSTRADDGFIDILRTHADGGGNVLQLRPHKDFLSQKGRDKLLSLRILSELPLYDGEDHLSSDGASASEPRSAYDFMRRRRETTGDPTAQRWNASVRLANFASLENATLCMGSIGALLDHITRIRAVGELDDDGIGGLEIKAIENFTLKEVMQINADALQSLQVFDVENHASINSDKTKEGLSLYGILNNTKTTFGRVLLREWLIRPSMSMATLSARHDAVECFMRPENSTLADTMHGHLLGIKNVPKTLAVLKAGKAKVSDWQAIVKLAFHTMMIHDSIPELSHASHVDVTKKLSKALDVARFKELGTTVNGTIDWDESALSGRPTVRPRIDEDLDNLKHVYAGLDGVLSTVARELSSTIPPDYASSLNVVYFPQLGYLICVPMQEEWEANGVTELEGWQFQFSSESYVYFKSQEMRDLDTHVGDIHTAIIDREIEIIHSLQEEVLEYEDSILVACSVCAELDCLLSFAEASRMYDFRRPEMVDENVLEIKKGRHPLQEIVVDTFVPNDAYVVGGDYSPSAEPVDSDQGIVTDEEEHEKNSVVVCTGANACGKSVYLKQIALIQYMAQIGCFVPAERARLGIVDKNGAGLFCGILRHFISLGPDCPKVIAATHFHDVFTTGLLDPDSLPITFLHMQVMFTNSKGELLGASDEVGRYKPEDEEEQATGGEDGESMVKPGERITYLYRVEKGLWLNSHAAVCAEIFGLPRSVTQRATYVSFLLSSHELGQLLDEEMNEDERAELAEAEEVCKQFLAWDLQTEPEVDEDVKEKLGEILGRAPGPEDDAG